MDGSTGDSGKTGHADEVFHETSTRKCPACGASARRDAARFCATCGRNLEEDYFPTDSLRASYRFERRPTPNASRAESASDRPRVAAAGAGRRRAARWSATATRTGARPQRDIMPSTNNNGASTTALAFATYALVPYVGILFCPGALLMGGIGLVRAYRAPHLGGRRASVTGIALGVLLFCVHLLLWWILYKVPEWTRTRI